MIALHLHLLTGRYVATAYDDRSAAEWPPHPARIVSALTDALYAAGAVCPDERAALEALIGWGPPEVLASPAHPRTVATVFVPVNDTSVTDQASLQRREAACREAREAARNAAGTATEKARKKADKAVEAFVAEARKRARFSGTVPSKNPAPKAMPATRTRQPRTFPTVVPHDPTVTLRWPEANLSPDRLAALERLAARVVRIGHSSSLVSLAVDPEGRERPDDLRSCHRPGPAGDTILRVPVDGHLDALDAAFARAPDTPGRVLPARHVAYERVGHDPGVGKTAHTDGTWIVYRLTPPHPPAQAAVALADAVRSALLARLPDPAPPALTGRTPGGPVRGPHLAILPLPFVGHRHADGAIRGFALSLPAGVPADVRRALFATLGRWENPASRRIGFTMGTLEVEAHRIVDPEETLATLRRGRWAAIRGTPSHLWRTVTPIALGGHCAPLGHRKAPVRRQARRTAARLVRKAVGHAVTAPGGRPFDLDRIEVAVHLGPPVPGAPHAAAFPTFQRPGHPHPRRQVHAVIRLPFPVHGPLVLGSGRHVGLGLCVPTIEPEGR